MWLALPVIVLLVLGIVGGLVVGGIYAAVLVPLAVIVGVAGFGYSIWASRREGGLPDERGGVDPLPHSGHSNTAATPSSPDQMADARRTQQ
ncbi:MAG: hypothetical protein WAK93_15410 [Solirubrobacteraceae bacterium]